MDAEFTETGQFLSRISATYTPKNKLHKTLLTWIDKYNRIYITDTDDFLFELKKLTERLSNKFLNCKPLALYVHLNESGKDIHLSISDIVIMDILVIQGEFKNAQILPYLPETDRVIKPKTTIK